MCLCTVCMNVCYALCIPYIFLTCCFDSMDIRPSTVLLIEATSGPSRSSWTGGQTSRPGILGLADTAIALYLTPIWPFNCFLVPLFRMLKCVCGSNGLSWLHISLVYTRNGCVIDCMFLAEQLICTSFIECMYGRMYIYVRLYVKWFC